MTRPSYSVLVTQAFALSVASGFVLTTPATANAQQIDEFGRYETEATKPNRESRRDFALELRFGPYLPRVDSEFSNGNTPFRDYFGTKNRFMVGAEFDWLPLTIPKTLRVGVGAGVSYTSMSTKAPKTADHGVKSAQDTRFRELPHWLVGVLRVDALHRRTPVPLVFVGKLGLANGLWWVKDDPSSNSAAGIKGHGMSYGVYYGGGVQLDLGFLDSGRARRLDNNVGINAMYFFGEFYGMELTSFGSSDAMHVGDRSWVLGLAMDI